MMRTYTIKVTKVEAEDMGPILDAIEEAGWIAEVKQDGYIES